MYTFVLPQDATAEQVRAHASGLFGTRGRMLSAYYYERGAAVPADGVTLAPNIARAIWAIYDNPFTGAWRHAYMEYRTGEREFVDCVATPSHDLCRR